MATISQAKVLPKILFVSHDASATGAPNSLLNFIDWNVQHQKCRFRVLLLDGGPLEEEFAKRGPTTTIRQSDRGLVVLLSRTWARIRRVFGPAPRAQAKWMPSRFEQGRVNACLSGFKVDLIFINSIAAAPALASFQHLDAPALTFLREMNEQVHEARNTGWLEALLDRTQGFIAVSEAARQSLAHQFHLREEKFSVIHPFINTGKLRTVRRTDSRAELIKRAGLVEADFIVAGCGTTNWRKGPDLFIAIARNYFENMDDDRTVFIWIGGLHSTTEQLQAAHDIRLAGLEGRVIFIGEQLDAANLLSGADVLALTSREEPFARVMLEASLGRCPVVCFKDGGGAPEFASKGCGLVVPYLSVTAFAAALQTLRQDDSLRTSLGDAAYHRTLGEHDVQTGAERVFAVVNSLLSRGRFAQADSCDRSAETNVQVLP